jgi:hypothetical protein
MSASVSEPSGCEYWNWGLACVDKLALGMQVVECFQKIQQSAFEQFLVASCRVPFEHVLPAIPLPAIPHGLMDQALKTLRAT